MKTLVAFISLVSLLFAQISIATFPTLHTSTGVGGQQNARAQEDARRKNFESQKPSRRQANPVRS
jgi:hypothetical protein